jgi:predicted NAD/FAD-binding protein
MSIRRSIGIVGSGIAGLTVAEGLYQRDDITVYESEAWVGGHTHTVEIQEGHRTLAVDTGFIVCNEWTYPNFLALMARHGIEPQNSNMSFSVRDDRLGLEYNGTDLNTLFAQRRNLVSPRFLGMIADILRFNRAAPALLSGDDPGPTLGEWLSAHGYGRRFLDHYILPMGRSIWSVREAALLGFPARFFIDFFQRHGFLNIDDRPVWKVIPGGSSRYVERLTAPFANRIRINSAVSRIVRTDRGVQLTLASGETVQHDAVVVATHADTALALLADPSPAELALLGAFAFESNDVILHTDERVLPRNRRAQAAWNYWVSDDPLGPCTLTYDMNVLQSLDCKKRYLVSLNLGAQIDPATILGRWSYAHPVYTPQAVSAQQRHHEISGVRHTYFAGAYWRYGFHEDGVVSGLRALEQLGV